jgi:hypothetical protein
MKICIKPASAAPRLPGVRCGIATEWNLSTCISEGSEKIRHSQEESFTSKLLAVKASQPLFWNMLKPPPLTTKLVPQLVREDWYGRQRCHSGGVW